MYIFSLKHSGTVNGPTKQELSNLDAFTALQTHVYSMRVATDIIHEREIYIYSGCRHTGGVASIVDVMSVLYDRCMFSVMVCN